MVRTFRLALGLALGVSACNPSVTVEVPPLANAGFDRVVLVGEQVTLDGSQSLNGKGQAGQDLEYTWDVVAVPEGSAASLDNAAVNKPSFIADATGTYIFRLVVGEGAAKSPPDFVNILARTALSIDWTVPEDGAVDVGLSAPVVVAFSQPVQAASVDSGTIGLSGPGGAVACNISIEPDSRTVILTPRNPLAAGSEHRLLVSQGVTDMWGGTLRAPVSLRFRTQAAGADTTPPTVVAVEPTPGQPAPSGVEVVVVLSEPVVVGTVSAASFAITDSTSTPVAGYRTVTAAGVRLSFAPDAPFTAGGTYTVVVDATITDLAGNGLDGDGDGSAGGSYSFTFTISNVADHVPPMVTAVVPGDGFIDVAPRTNVLVSFSEAIDPTTLSGTSFVLAPIADVGTPVAATVSLDAARRMATLAPDGWLALGTTYIVTVSDGVRDLAGNALDGDGDGAAGGSFVSRFTTGTPTGETGILTVTDPLSPGMTLEVTLTDADADATGSADVVQVIVTTDSGDTETIDLTETGPQSGEFTGALPTVFVEFPPGLSDNGTLGVQGGDLITVAYHDLLGTSGAAEDVSATADVVGGIDGTASVVNAPGNELVVTVRDSDIVANPTTGTDILGCGAFAPCVTVSTSSTGDSEVIPLMVESTDGVFSATITTAVSMTATPGNGTLEIAGAATVTVDYVDALRANGDSRGYLVSSSTNIALAKVIIRDQPGGLGGEVGALTITTDDTVTLYAAGYDAGNKYLGDVTVDWTVAGGIGVPNPASGASTVFEPSTVGTGGVTATHQDSGVTPDSTGFITVVAGGVSRVTIRDAGGGLGNIVDLVSMSTDETRTFYAAGYDGHGNFVADTSVAWSVLGGIGSASPVNGSSTVFNAATVGTGRVRATPASMGVAADETNTITVSGGALSRVEVYSAAGGPAGGGSPVGNVSVSTDGTVTLYAAGFDADGNYLGDQSVAWSATGGIGVVAPTTGSSTAFDPRVVGSGTITADHATAQDDSTGSISVTAGGLNHVTIRDSAGGLGTVVGNASLTTDQTLSLYAAGYDADNNFVGDVSVTWTVSGGIGVDTPWTGSSTTFDARTVGTGSITADHATAIDDSTGTITVSAGALASVKIRDAANNAGVEVGAVSVASDQTRTYYAAGYDADGNFIGDQNTAAWSVSGSIGGVAPATGSSTVFNPNRVGSGTVSVTVGVYSDATGAITVTAGALASLKIRTASGGGGVEVTTVSISVSNTLPLYIAGYDVDGNYISPDPSVTWSKAGVGNVAPASGTSTVFTPSGSGTATVTATSGAINDSTGTITVTTSMADLAYVKALNAAGCTGTTANGTEVGATSLSTDATLALYAVGFNAFNECLGNVSVTWTLTGGIGAVSPAAGTNTTFNPATVGTGTITADHATATDDSTGTITVTVGALASVKIRDAANNAGIEVGALTVASDQTRTFYAAGYDADGNYIGDQATADWSVIGGIGGTPASGSSYVFNPSIVGAGSVSVTVGTHTDSTGTITVIAGALASIKIRNAPGGAGVEVTTSSMTVSDTLTLYAAGYDTDGNYINDPSVTWSKAGVGNVAPATGNSTVFTPSGSGTATVTATSGAINDSTGTITVTTSMLDLNYVKVMNASGCTGTAANGTEVGVTSVTTDNTLVLYAVGFNSSSECLGDVSVTWVLTGGIGSVSPTTGTTTAFNPTTVGTGTITADHATVTDDSTGTITVTAGALASVKIRDAANNAGVEVGAVTMASDQTRTFYAAGYDADDNYIGDQATAAWTVIGGIGGSPGSGSSYVFNPSIVGTGTVNVAVGARTDSTGTITVTAGALASIKIRTAAGGAGVEVTTVSITVSDTLPLYVAGYDVDGNYISPDPSVTWSKAGLGSVAPATGSSTVFTPTGSGTATVTATSGAMTDSTGTITITTSMADLDYVKVMNLSGCTGTAANGTEVGNTAITTDGTLVLYAVGFNAVNECLGDVAVTWVLNGGCGVLAVGPNTTTTFDPQTPGTPTITADHANAAVTDDTTGTITISVGAVAAVKVRNAAGGGGTEVGNLSITTDNSQTFYAAGYDADGNYVGAASVNWSVTGAAIGTVNPVSSSNQTTFNPTTPGVGRVLADHPTAGVTDDATGDITVAVGALANIKIRDAAGGGGAEVAALPGFSADNSATFYAAGYDADANYIADQSVTWSVTGGIGTIVAGPGTSTTFDATTVGSGLVNADSSSLGPNPDDSTGTISVVAGAIHHVLVRDTAGGGGAVVGARTLSTDATLVVYAAGYDADGNFIADQSVAWSVTGGIGSVAPASGTTTTFNPNVVGLGTVIADHATGGVTDGQTGDLTVIGGALKAVKIRDASDGLGAEVGALTLNADQTTNLYAAGYDTDNNYLGEQTVTWTVTNGIGVFAPTPASSTVFSANVVGTGVITADYSGGGVTDDTTGTITVTAGSLHEVRIRTAAGGGGTVVGNDSLNADQSRTWYAAGYDADGNYISTAPTVTWVVAGGIGTVTPATGTSTVFAATRVGNGTVTADSAIAGVIDGVTGTITVTVGALAALKVRDAGGGLGVEVGDITQPQGQAKTYYAAGYDADGNYIADQSATWSLTIITGPVSGAIAPASGQSTVFTPNNTGEASITATFAPATPDTTGKITIVASGAPTVTSASPSAAFRNSTGLALTITGTNFSNAGGTPAVTFLPAGNISVTGVTFVSASRLDITVTIPCGAAVQAYDIMVTNPPGAVPPSAFGIGSALLTVSTGTEGPYKNATCSDGKDNDCDGGSDGADLNCKAPNKVNLSCTTPATTSTPSSCTASLTSAGNDPVLGQTAHLTCVAKPQSTVLFTETFDGGTMGAWTASSNWESGITLPGSSPAKLVGRCQSVNWTQRTCSATKAVSTVGMDRVCVDLRIAKNGVSTDVIRVQFSMNGGTNYYDAAVLDFNTWHAGAALHDVQNASPNFTTATNISDWAGQICITDMTDLAPSGAGAANNANFRVRLNAAMVQANNHFIYIEDFRVIGTPGTKTNIFNEKFPTTAAAPLTYANWTVENGGAALSVKAVLNGNNQLAATSTSISSAELRRCFATTGYDVVDFRYNFAQSAEDAANRIRWEWSVNGSGGPYSPLTDILLDSGTGTVGGWNQNDTLIDHFKLYRLTDLDANADNNASVCLRLHFGLRTAATASTLYVDDVIVDGIAMPTTIFTVSALTDAGNGNYNFTVGANRVVTSEVNCTWSWSPDPVLTTDCSGSSSCPAIIKFN